MNKIIGLERKNGVFKNDNGENINYDNTIIYYITDCNSDVNGFKGCQIKVKTSNLCKWLSCNLADLPTVLINQKVNFDYDFSYSPPILCGLTIINDDKK